jgi:transketolase
MRDISLFGALPNLVILEPCNAIETKWALDWCVNAAEQSCMLRLVISPSPRSIALPQNYRFTPGKGAVLNQGADAVLFAYGPVMLNEALKAAELLQGDGITLKVVNLPWLNKVDTDWLEEVVGDCNFLFSLDNHSPYGGLGDLLLNGLMASTALRQKQLGKFAVDDFPACGTPPEALHYHKLDGQSLTARISKTIDKK